MKNQPVNVKDKKIIKPPEEMKNNGEKRLFHVGLYICLIILFIAFGAFLTHWHISIRDCQARIDNLPNRNEYALLLKELRCFRDEFREFRKDFYFEQHQKLETKCLKKN